MKHLIIIIIVLLVSSCKESGKKIIYSKDYNSKKECICNYDYLTFGSRIWFQDSCNKYNIGDTIK